MAVGPLVAKPPQRKKKVPGNREILHAGKAANGRQEDVSMFYMCTFESTCENIHSFICETSQSQVTFYFHSFHFFVKSVKKKWNFKCEKAGHMWINELRFRCDSGILCGKFPFVFEKSQVDHLWRCPVHMWQFCVTCWNFSSHVKKKANPNVLVLNVDTLVLMWSKASHMYVSHMWKCTYLMQNSFIDRWKRTVACENAQCTCLNFSCHENCQSH